MPSPHHIEACPSFPLVRTHYPQQWLWLLPVQLTSCGFCRQVLSFCSSFSLHFTPTRSSRPWTTPMQRQQSSAASEYELIQMAMDVTNHSRRIVPQLHKQRPTQIPKRGNSATAKTPTDAPGISTSQQKQKDTEKHDGCRLQTSFSTLRIPKQQSILTQEEISSSTIQTSREHSSKDRIYP